MSLKARIILGIVFIAALCVVQLVATNKLTAEVAADFNHLESRDFKLVQNIGTSRLAIVQVQQWLTDISATRGLDGLDDGFKEAQIAAKSFEDGVNQIEQLAPDFKTVLAPLRVSFDAYYRSGVSMANAYVEGGPAMGNQTMGQFDVTASRLAQQFDALEAKVRVNVEHQFKELHKDFGLLQSISSWLQSVLIIAVLIVGIYFNSSLLKPLHGLSESVRKLHSGEVSTEVSIEEPKVPELKSLASEFNLLVAKIREVVSSLAQEVIQSSSSINSISQKMDQAESIAHELNGQTASQASALTEMQATSVEVSDNAQLISERVNAAKMNLEKGSQLVNQTGENITSVSNQTEETESSIYILNERATDISSMLGIIKGIAEQTNLLALNAAIEAARAGEQGRGFAVVADEVRSLANKTQESSQDIENILSDLQSSVNQAVSSMEASRSMMAESVKNAALSGEIISEVSQLMMSIDDNARATAEAMRQQSEVADEQVKAIVDIDNLSSESASGTAAVNAEISQIKQRMHTMIEHASKFA